MALWIITVNTEKGMTRYEVNDEHGAYRHIGIAMRPEANARDYYLATRAIRANVMRRLGDEQPVFGFREGDAHARGFVEMLNA